MWRFDAPSRSSTRAITNHCSRSSKPKSNPNSSYGDSSTYTGPDTTTDCHLITSSYTRAHRYICSHATTYRHTNTASDSDS